MLLSSFCDMFQPDKKQHASHINFLCNIFTLSKGNISSISLWISSRLFVRNLHWWNKSSLNYQNIDLKSYKSLAWLKRRIQWERKNRKRASPVLKEELIGCETSRSVDVYGRPSPPKIQGCQIDQQIHRWLKDQLQDSIANKGMAWPNYGQSSFP